MPRKGELFERFLDEETGYRDDLADEILFETENLESPHGQQAGCLQPGEPPTYHDNIVIHRPLFPLTLSR